MDAGLSIFSLQGLGNSVLALPLVEVLKKYYPIRLYLMNNGSYDFYRELEPGIETECFHNKFEIFTKCIRKSEIALSFYPTGKKETIALLRSKSAQKFSFAGSKVASLLFKSAVKWEEVHDIENNFRLLEALGVRQEYPDLSSLVPRGESGRAVSLHPTASTPRKYYSHAFWVGLIDYLVASGFDISLFSGSGEGEKRFCVNIMNSVKDASRIEFCAGLNFREVAKKIGGSKLFVGSDSALMHLAALMDVFTIGLWSFADYRRIYPYGSNVHVYVPGEILNAKRFDYPRHDLPWMGRAKYRDIIDVMESAKKASFAIDSRFKGGINFYIY